MKKRARSLNKKVLALGLTGALLGSVGYVLPVAAAEVIEIKTTDEYTTKYGTDDVKPSSGSLTDNQVTIGMPGSTSATEPSIGTSGDKSMYGGYASGSEEVSHNTVTVHSGKMNAAYGGRGDGVVTGNSVTISGGEMSFVYGGHSKVDATDNSVTVSGGATIKRDIYGGHSRGAVTGNKVTISGGTVEGNVYAGYSSNSGYTGNFKDNSITISSEGGSKPSFGTTTVLYGWKVSAISSYDKTSGNTLNIKTSGIEVSNVKNFEAYNFYLQSDTKKDDVLLTLTDTNGTDISNSSVKVGLAGSANILQVGDSVTLMKNASDNGIKADNVTYGRITQGVSLIYDFETALSEDGKELVTTIREAATVSADTKSPVETQAAAMGFINSGADMLVGSGMASAVAVAGAGEAEIFGAMGGGSMRYKTGSYADVHG